jgi:hypothetical protein
MINSGWVYGTHDDPNPCQTSTDTEYRFFSVVPCQIVNLRLLAVVTWRTHIPSQVAGNDTTVRRARQQIKNDVLGPGRYLAGGMWVRGLCDKCNHMSGVKVDRAWVSLTNDDIAPILVGDVQPW